MCLCRRKRNNIIVGRPYTDCAERRRLDRDREKEGGREKERERERIFVWLDSLLLTASNDVIQLVIPVCN